MATSIDLTPFGFTPTESLVYAALLKLGPTTGYAVGRATRLARANAYGALEGLVSRGAAAKATGRPVRFRPLDPQALLAHLAAGQGEALDRLTRSLREADLPAEPATREIAGARAVANLILQLVARADARVEGVLAADLWRPTLPGWRRAASRATIELAIAGDPGDTQGLTVRTAPADSPTVLVVDDAQVVLAAGSGEAVAAVWSSHPLVVAVVKQSLRVTP